jgi:hypothetical protein
MLENPGVALPSFDQEEWQRVACTKNGAASRWRSWLFTAV